MNISIKLYFMSTFYTTILKRLLKHLNSLYPMMLYEGTHAGIVSLAKNPASTRQLMHDSIISFNLSKHNRFFSELFNEVYSNNIIFKKCSTSFRNAIIRAKVYISHNNVFYSAKFC